MNIKKFLVGTAASALVLGALVFPAFAAKADKVKICHLDKDSGIYYLLNINGNALDAHLAHGDGLPLEAVPGETGYVFSGTCEVLQILSTPEFTSPANGSVLTTVELTEIDWTASTGTCLIPSITYQYQAFSDSAYTVPVYTSGWLTENKIPTPGTPAGNYYIQVRAKDGCGNTTDWSNDSSNPYLITVENPTHVTSGILNFGPTGWGGWSCPAGTTVVDGSLVVSGGDLAATYAWKPGATTGTVDYPATPFGYTYGPGETGYIGQNDNDSGESIVFDFDCMPNL